MSAASVHLCVNKTVGRKGRPVQHVFDSRQLGWHALTRTIVSVLDGDMVLATVYILDTVLLQLVPHALTLGAVVAFVGVRRVVGHAGVVLLKDHAHTGHRFLLTLFLLLN